MEREDYLKALEVNERDRVVLYEGGYYMGHRDGVEEGRAEGLATGRQEGRAAGIEEGRAEGRATGRQEGRAAALEAVVKRLKQMGYSDADIKKVTNF